MTSISTFIFLLGSLYSSTNNDLYNPYLSIEVVEQLTSDLILLEKFPSADDILNLELVKEINNPQQIDADRFLHLIRLITPLDPKNAKLKSMTYAPSVIFTFTTKEGDYKATMFDNGLGFLLLPNGEKGAFLLDFSKLSTLFGNFSTYPTDEDIWRVDIVQSSGQHESVWVDNYKKIFTLPCMIAGTDDLTLYPDANDFYPVIVRDYTIDKPFFDFTTLFFVDPYGYDQVWNEKYRLYLQEPIMPSDQQRIITEQSYIKYFNSQYPDKTLTFETIEIESERNDAFEKWRFAIIEDKK